MRATTERPTDPDRDPFERTRKELVYYLAVVGGLVLGAAVVFVYALAR